MENLKEFQEDVRNFYASMENKTKSDIFYKVFLSRFSYDADVLFIGINPGAGEDRIRDENEGEYFEYLKHDFTLARETRKIFELAGYPDLLKKLDENNSLVKTNFFYYISKDVSDLSYFRNTILGVELKQVYYEKCIEWTNWIIKNCDPKIIICEGKWAFEEVEITINENRKEEKPLETASLITFENKDFTVIKYNRRQSRICDKESVSKLLKEALQIHNIK